MNVDVLVVGAGPAGLAAAVAAKQAGAKHVLVVERSEHAGGILQQCVHDGFGLHLYGSALTGPEYACTWADALQESGAQLALGTTVLNVAETNVAGADNVTGNVTGAGGVLHHIPSGFTVEAVGAAVGGHVHLQARAVVVATGCRERTRGQLMVPGTRPSGVITAGTAQYLINVRNELPGDKVVILGSGDIGLIMARRLALEGADVRMVLGLEATGLLRNHVRCIQDFNIAFRAGWGVASVHGQGQLKGVRVAPLGAEGKLDETRAEYVRCNLLLIACGLIPECEILKNVTGAENVTGTGGVLHRGVLRPPGIFVCGNADRPFDLVDQVTQEGIKAGQAAARFAGAAGALPENLQALLRIKVKEPTGRLADIDALDAIPCTICPTGCIMRVGKNGAVTGNQCKRGLAFAQQELAQPMRLFTGTVRLQGSLAGSTAASCLLPVRTSADIPREALFAVARACRNVVVQAPVQVGSVVCENIANTGADLVACANVPDAPFAGPLPEVSLSEGMA